MLGSHRKIHKHIQNSMFKTRHVTKFLLSSFMTEHIVSLTYSEPLSFMYAVRFRLMGGGEVFSLSLSDVKSITGGS